MPGWRAGIPTMIVEQENRSVAVRAPDRTPGPTPGGFPGKRAIRNLKVIVFIACLAPLAYLIYMAIANDLGADPIATITHFTGFATLRLLVITLAITPMRRVSIRLSWLIRFRRMLGLFAFFYGCLHLLTYVVLFSGFSVSTMVDDIAKRPYIMAGVSAWILMLPLAITSTQQSMRRLGGKRWQGLHRLIYASAILGVMHYWWVVKSGVRTPITITVVLALLLSARILWRLQSTKQSVARA
jgi:methionine sulfoxide reductase heme-binding subunit